MSNGWLYGFCNRFPITNQMTTEKKYKSVEERIPTIVDFHRKICAIQNIYPEVCPIWGAFPPNRIWNADHIPAPFAINLKRSLNPKGQPCWIAVVGPSGLDKRQATLHPCIRAAGAQLAPCWIIFRGKGNISQREKDFLNSLDNIRWAFQPRAWADGVYTLEWAEAYCDMLEKECPGEEHMLLLDELSSQMTPTIKKYLKSRGVLPVYIPGGCTDVLQPVDHHFGALLKRV
jgi:hypothetical protein